jgi:hypothetical protein
LTQINAIIGNLRSGAGHVLGVLGSDSGHWKAQYERVEQEKEGLRADYEKLRLQKDQEHRALEVRIRNMDQSSQNAQELLQRLATTNQQNTELREQVSKFREIILKKTNNPVQEIPDSTLINFFVDLRVQIQHIVFKFYRFDRAHHLKLKGATSTQQDFFGSFGRDYSEAQLKRRARGKIFEILSGQTLRRPIFGLDDFDKEGELEDSLRTFESTLNSIPRGKQYNRHRRNDAKFDTGHESEIAEWRSRTVKCSRLLQCPESKQPNRIMEGILEFMEPISPDRKSEKYGHLRDALLELCAAAFKLSLQLRECKDLYRCEFPNSGSPFIEDEFSQQDSESAKRGEFPATRIAFAMSGALVKYPENQPGSRIVLEKAHVVTCD